MAESVKVIVRCRPMNAREYGLNCKEVINIDGKIGQCSIINPNDSKVPPKMFTFDGAYDTASTTEQIYADIGFPLVEVRTIHKIASTKEVMFFICVSVHNFFKNNDHKSWLNFGKDLHHIVNTKNF